ncbi:MAG: hypothetical protein J3Q66DRAFT_70791 [Benniella sp.]|nr:MAG: hypothetical protein J3Q66DRAFT_70791 [Benniella sp.]
MLFAKTLIVLCSATVAMAACHNRNQWEMGRSRYETSMGELLRCKCGDPDPLEDGMNSYLCSLTLGEMEWCRSGVTYYCQTGDMGSVFRESCEDRSPECKVVEC